MSIESEMQSRNACLCPDMFFNLLRVNEFGMNEMNDALESTREWLQVNESSVAKVQKKSEFMAVRIASRTEYILRLLKECEDVLALKNITEFNKALIIIPKLSAIEYFKAR